MKGIDNIRTYAWLELFVWLVVITLCVFGVRYHYHQSQKQYKSYQIFMSDVDGLIVGSPVKFLGIQIGHVTKIQIVSSDVYSDIYIKFIITQKDLTLPTGAIATVEGTGLGGSKSLEIYPPEGKTQDKIIVSKDSTRLNKVMSLFNTIFKDLEEIFTNLGHVGQELSDVPHQQIEKNVVIPTQANDELKDINIQLDKYINEEKKLRKQFNKKRIQPRTEMEQDENSESKNY